MKIGLQNFQGIGAYTEIPIAPITLFYGPNSAGKSMVTDANEFLHRTLGGHYGDWQKQLERHARHNRRTQPLERNYKGKPDDVVFTASGTFGCGEFNNDWLNINGLDSKELMKVLYPSRAAISLVPSQY